MLNGNPLDFISRHELFFLLLRKLIEPFRMFNIRGVDLFVCSRHLASLTLVGLQTSSMRYLRDKNIK